MVVSGLPVKNDAMGPKIAIDNSFLIAYPTLSRLLERRGVELDFNPGRTCCGKMHANTGSRGEGFALAKRLLRRDRDAEAVMIPSSCVTRKHRRI